MAALPTWTKVRTLNRITFPVMMRNLAGTAAARDGTTLGDERRQIDGPRQPVNYTIQPYLGTKLI